MLQISSELRRTLRSQAHNLNPVVSIASQGLTEAVLKEIEISLKAHELIKIRVYGDDRASREAFLNEICDTLGAAFIQHIGKLLVVWRPNHEDSQATTNKKPLSPRRSQARKTKRSFQR